MLRFRTNEGVVLGQLAKARDRMKDPRPVLEAFGEYMVHESVRKNFEAEGRPHRWPRSAWSSQRQQNRSGGRGLLGSIRSEVLSNRLRVGTNKKYARQRQLGGIIKPKKARALAIPLPHVPENMARPRRWGKRLFKLPSTKGDPATRGVLAVKGADGRPRPMFVLRSKVEQPARPFLLFHPEDLAWVSRRASDYILTGAMP